MAKQQDNKRKGKSFDKGKKSKPFNKARRASNLKPNSSKKPSTTGFVQEERPTCIFK